MALQLLGMRAPTPCGRFRAVIRGLEGLTSRGVEYRANSFDFDVC